MEHYYSKLINPNEEEMITLVRKGRYGITTACRKVYADNSVLFQAWQEGNTELDSELGNYQTFMDQTILYKDGYDVTDLGTHYPQTVTGCVNIDCVDLAEQLIAQGFNPAIHNLASAAHPGGGYSHGKHAQEESLCQASNLSQSLYQFANPKKLKFVQASGVATREIGYPLDINYGGVYTPNVTFFRNNSSKYFTLKENPFTCDVITVAALSFSGKSEHSRMTEQLYRAPSGGFNQEGTDIMLNKIRTIFRMGVEHGKDALVLGAFGCGAYRLPIPDVVRLFRVVMEEPEFKNKFRLLVFAILESTHKPHGENGKFAEFYQEFGTYSL